MEGIYHWPRRLLLDTAPAYGPANGSRTRGAAGAYSSEANFDTNMVIILAALLCALICALGLNSIVRCALRCSRRFAAEEAAAAGRGVKKSALRRIPVAVYGNSGVDIPATDCPICLGDFADGEKVRVLPRCHHGFHVGCIDTWLLSHSSCPNCRQSLLAPAPETPPPGINGDGEGRRDLGRGAGAQQGGDVATGIDEVG